MVVDGEASAKEKRPYEQMLKALEAFLELLLADSHYGIASDYRTQNKERGKCVDDQF